MTPDERLRILEMLREGKLSVAEADRLLGALAHEPPGATPAGRARLIRVRISGHRGQNVSFTLPLTLVDVLEPFLPKRVRVDDREIDLGRLLTGLSESGVPGKVLDFRDHRNNHIEITVE